jgi:hypothetical protein
MRRFFYVLLGLLLLAGAIVYFSTNLAMYFGMSGFKKPLTETVAVIFGILYIIGGIVEYLPYSRWRDK